MSRIELRDAETNELLVVGRFDRNSAQSVRDHKGWVLRWRTAHKRRTGNKILVVECVDDVHT